MWETYCSVFGYNGFVLNVQAQTFLRSPPSTATQIWSTRNQRELPKSLKVNAHNCRYAQIYVALACVYAKIQWLTVSCLRLTEGGKFAAARKAPGKSIVSQWHIYQHQFWIQTRKALPKNTKSLLENMHSKSQLSNRKLPLLDFPFTLFTFFLSIIYLWVLPPILHVSHIFPPWHVFFCLCLPIPSINSPSSFTAGMRRRTRLVRHHHKPRQWIQQRENTFGLTAETECISRAPGRALEDWKTVDQ